MKNGAEFDKFALMKVGADPERFIMSLPRYW